MNTSPLCRIKEAAAFLGVCDKTIRRLIDCGKLLSVKIRGIHFIHRDSLMALVQTGTA
jgi:excisionase family DNA binding protein